jgi:hypothetical protein
MSIDVRGVETKKRIKCNHNSEFNTTEGDVLAIFKVTNTPTAM